MSTHEDENNTSSLTREPSSLLQISAGDIPNGSYQLTEQRRQTTQTGKYETGCHDFRVPNQRNGTRDVETDYASNVHEFQLPRPRYPDFALKSTRVTSFTCWPSHLKPAGLMSEGGFFHSTSSDSRDCVRCFQCGIGLRNWDPEDDPWVEHARWSCNCPYLRMQKGQAFIDLVQAAVRRAQIEETLEQNSRDTNSRDDIDVDAPLASENQREAVETLKPTTIERKNPLLTSAAQSVLEMGYLPKVVKKAVDEVLQEKGWVGMNGPNILGAIFKYEEEEKQTSEMKKESIERKMKVPNISSQQKSKHILQSNNPDTLRVENEQLKEQTTCKICCENTVSIVFLPCGHLVCCAQCSPALKDCPVCRTTVKGTVRVCLA